MGGVDEPPARGDAGDGLVGDRGVGEVAPLGQDIVHSVTNPLDRLTCALHVYGGDFFGVDRSEWDPEDLTEKPYDFAKNMGAFAEANRR